MFTKILDINQAYFRNYGWKSNSNQHVLLMWEALYIHIFNVCITLSRSISWQWDITCHILVLVTLIHIYVLDMGIWGSLYILAPHILW